MADDSKPKTAHDAQHDFRAAVERVHLLFQAEADEIDSEFQARLADSGSLAPDAWLALLEDYCLSKFDVDFRWLSPMAKATDPDLKPSLEECLAFAEHRQLKFAANVLQDAKPEIRDRFLARLGLRLHAKTSGLLAEAKRNRFDASAQPKLPRVLPQVTPAIVRRRKRLLADYRRKSGQTRADIARAVGIGDSAIGGIVREERKRFATETRDRLLKFLGVELEDWYQP